MHENYEAVCENINAYRAYRFAIISGYEAVHKNDGVKKAEDCSSAFSIVTH